MTASKPDEILGKLPKTTPVWAVGVVSVIVALSVSFTTMYLIGKSEIEKLIEGRAKTAEVKVQMEGETLQVVLSLIKDNSQQITNLSSSNLKLTERVAAIEVELGSTQKALVDCQAALKKCGAK